MHGPLESTETREELQQSLEISSLPVHLGLPHWLLQWLSGKEPACNAGDPGDVGSIPGSERSPGGKHSNPLQDSCLENPMDRGAWWATVHEVAELDAIEWLSMHICQCVQMQGQGVGTGRMVLGISLLKNKKSFIMGDNWLISKSSIFSVAQLLQKASHLLY